MIQFNPNSRPLASFGARAFCLGLAACLLAGCMTPTPYAPRLEGERAGYTDRALTQNRYRVTFTGHSATPRGGARLRVGRDRPRWLRRGCACS